MPITHAPSVKLDGAATITAQKALDTLRVNEPRARYLKARPSHALRNRPQPFSMRRAIAGYLRDALTSREKREWAAAMGVSMSRVTLSLSANHCEQHPVRAEDLLFLPRHVREGLFVAMEGWAALIEKGAL